MIILEKSFLILLQTSLTASIGIISIILILKVLKNRISVRVTYILWILILIRLLIPVTEQMNLISKVSQNYNYRINSVAEINNQYEQNENSIKKSIYRTNFKSKVSTNNNLPKEIVKENFFLKVVKIFTLIWVMGITIIISTFLICLFKFKNEAQPLEDNNIQEQIEELACKLKVNKKISLFKSSITNSPCISGIFKPKIYIPEYMIKENESKENEHIFMHELMHYKRKDLFYNFLSTIALSIHWFNPLVWMVINNIKIYREYVCDESVLENLGEEKKIDYGMTLLRLSKLSLNNNKNKYSKLAVCFESKNQIKRRIEMIKKFKNDSSKISKKTGYVLAIIAVATLTTGITINALDINKIKSTSSETKTELQTDNKFLVDSDLKSYDDIKKVQRVAGFDFKLPDYALDAQKPEAYQVNKVSETSNAVEVYFYSPLKLNGEGVSIKIFKDDAVDALKAIEKNHSFAGEFTVDINNKGTGISSKKGEDITITLSLDNNDDSYESKLIEKSFVWEDDGVSYAITYNRIIMNGDNNKIITNISKEELEKMVNSLKPIDKIENINYTESLTSNEVLSTDTTIMKIYDSEDIKEAESIVGFTPKVVAKVQNDMNLSDVSVGLCSDSDINNNDIYYNVSSYYYNQNKKMTSTQSIHDEYGEYSKMKSNGYVIKKDPEIFKDEKIEVEKISINDIEVFKYKQKSRKDQPEEGYTSDLIYMWEENGVYNSLIIFDQEEYEDNVVQDFIRLK